jgi:hypothetical protein
MLLGLILSSFRIAEKKSKKKKKKLPKPLDKACTEE